MNYTPDFLKIVDERLRRHFRRETTLFGGVSLVLIALLALGQQAGSGALRSLSVLLGIPLLLMLYMGMHSLILWRLFCHPERHTRGIAHNLIHDHHENFISKAKAHPDY